jgi:hypothetical protein
VSGRGTPAYVTAAAERMNRAHAELTMARRELRQVLEARALMAQRQPGYCGTPAGYKRHDRDNEVPCHACVEAKTWERQRSARR